MHTAVSIIPASPPRPAPPAATAPKEAHPRLALALPRGRARPRGRDAGEIVFVEVKARRRNAAEAVSARQWARIGAAASRYLAEHTDGATPCRFDLALVDGQGRLERIENARSFDGW
jgi:hypothetical protein